jgi:3-hydroxy-5-phosphonooxypentane-2,4-dione thiolase
MDWGMKNRISRIIQPKTGKTVMLAVDHGYFLGPVSRLEDPRKTIAPLIPFADALMPTRGLLRHCIDPASNVPIVLRVSSGNTILNEDLSDEEVAVGIEDAIRLNAAAVALSVYIGSAHEHQTLMALSNLIDEGNRYGIPVLAVTAVGKELEKRDARYLSICCRIVAELGASIVKTYFCDDFHKIIESCPIPVVIAGGPRLRTELDALTMAYEAIKLGAVGVDMGRNIWQSKHPIAMISAIRAIVHEQASVEKAVGIFERLKAS